MSRVKMFCDGLSPQGHPGYNAHPGSTPYIVVVEFEEAIKNPPRCSVHDRPYLTTGGYRLARLAARWRETGPELECRFSGKGEGQGVSCYSHDWHGVYHDLNEDHCPSYPIAAWLIRRHEYGATQEAAR